MFTVLSVVVGIWNKLTGNILIFIGDVSGHNANGKHFKIVMVNYIGGNNWK